MKTLGDNVRSVQYMQVVQHAEKLGHILNDFPAASYGQTKTTCKHCGLYVTIKLKRRKLPEGKINLQMVAKGPLLVTPCAAGQA